MSEDHKKKDRWPLRRNITLVMMILCGAMLGLFIVRGVWNADEIRISIILAFGLVLGVMYLRRRGRLPEWLYRLARVHALLTWRGSPVIVPDDEPGNISPKVYLPLIFGALAIGAVLVWMFW